MIRLFSSRGRVNRKDYIQITILTLISYMSMFLIPFKSTLDYLVCMFITVPFMSVMFAIHFSSIIKRLHDIGKSGISILLLGLPIYNVFLFILLLLKKGDLDNNDYGDVSLYMGKSQNKF